MDKFQDPRIFVTTSGLDFGKNLVSESSPSSLSSSHTWNGILPQLNRSHQQLRKLSEWGIEALKDNSPTVVPQEQFESQEHFFDYDYRNEFDSPPLMESKWEKQVDLVFSQVPYEDSNSFVDEFQYEIITSQLLTDSSVSSYRLIQGQKSILDFHKRSEGLIRDTRKKVPTKYGKLYISGKKFFLQKTVPYLTTLFFTRKALRKMLFKRHLKRSSIMTVFLIALYLALQQEFFYTKYSKYTSLINLKQLTSSLRSLDKLLYRYNLIHKEFTVYRPIAIAQQHGLDVDNSRDLALVEELLSSTLAQMYHQLRIVTNAVLPVINSSQLTNYTGIYGVNLLELYHSIWNPHALGLNEKFERVQQLKKFLLCCLLSVNDSIPLKDSKVTNMLRKLFPDYEPRICTDFEKFQLISMKLHELNQCINTISPVLYYYKSLFYSFPSFHAEKTDMSSKSENETVSRTIFKLVELEKHLTFQDGISDELNDHVLSELHNILKLWNNPRPKKNHALSHRGPEPPKIVGQRVVSGGFNLEVVKTTKKQDSVVYSSVPKLDSLIDVTEIDETTSDVEKDDEEIFYDHGNDHGNDHDDSFTGKNFSKFTDEQLRYELNQRIMKLALENKKSRDSLRKKKSLELMTEKKQIDKLQGRPVVTNKDTFNSEESIPVLFELKQYLDANK